MTQRSVIFNLWLDAAPNPHTTQPAGHVSPQRDTPALPILTRIVQKSREMPLQSETQFPAF